MHEHGLIVFQEARDGKEDFLDEQLLNDLDSAIDDVFEEEGFSVRKEEHPASRVEAALQAALEPQLQIRETVSIDVAAARSGIRQRIAIASTQALQNYWIPALIMAIFLICVGVIPLYLWQGAFEVFAG
jgi:hypothetical protein